MIHFLIIFLILFISRFEGASVNSGNLLPGGVASQSVEHANPAPSFDKFSNLNPDALTRLPINFCGNGVCPKAGTPFAVGQVVFVEKEEAMMSQTLGDEKVGCISYAGLEEMAKEGSFQHPFSREDKKNQMKTVNNYYPYILIASINPSQKGAGSADWRPMFAGSKIGTKLLSTFDTYPKHISLFFILFLVFCVFLTFREKKQETPETYFTLADEI